jgi:DNA-directed RNA polymerase specialized sigma24 family protein
MVVRPVREGASLEEIEAVYRQRMSDFVRVATAIVGERESGRDVVQEAFARAVAGRASFRGEGPLQAWLWRIVVNLARSHTGRLSGTGRSIPGAGENGA